MLVSVLFAGAANLWHFIGWQQVKISLNLVRRENAGWSPRIAKLLGVDLRCLGVSRLKAESILDILQLFMVNLMVLARTFACLTGFPGNENSIL